MNLYAQARGDWDLADDQKLLLAWAARLHELGLDIAHAHYHRHGAYVLENADMPGFPREEQQVLACLVLAHRRKFERSVFSGLPLPWQRPALRLAILLRLAALVHRSRTGGATPDLKLRVQGRTLRLQVPAAWLQSNPLTLADLERERDFLDGSRLQADHPAPDGAVGAPSGATRFPRESRPRSQREAGRA